jgi:dipeptidyl aminopeptidase/acylaminoacyl peptidase
MRNIRFLLIALLVVFVCFSAAEEKYQKPPKAVLDVLNAPPTPLVEISPTRDTMVLMEWQRYPSIAELAQPMLRLAGLRINPKTNGPHRRLTAITGLMLKKLPNGKEVKLATPAGGRLGAPEFSYDGKQFAFINTTPAGIELWVGNTATASVRKLAGIRLNGAYGDAVRWMPDNKTLLVQTIPAGRGAPPAAPTVPAGPNAQESVGVKAGAWTFQDLLKTPHDEKLFEYYTTSQLVLLDTATGAATPIGKPGIYQAAVPSPDGKLLLTARIHRPYSYLYPLTSFPKEVEVWDRAGKMVHKVASLPLADSVPQDGVPTGPRNYGWRPTEPATLAWVEALDGGDPKNKVPHRDRVLMLKAPFSGAPVEVVKTEHRLMGGFGGGRGGGGRGGAIEWGEKSGVAIVRDYDREKRWTRSFLINVDNPAETPKLLWSLDSRDRYRNPGSPVMRTLPTGQRVLLQKGDFIYLEGQGSSPEGDRPFLDRFNLKTAKPERLFRCDADSYESVIALLDDEASRVITRRESPILPPNYHIRGGSGDPKPITRFPDPAPQLRGIKKELVKYKRDDGVQLSFTLYLPPDYKPGTRLPTVMWAYPLEYNDPDTAGQIVGSRQRFTSISGMSHLFFLFEGYAIMDGATLPVIGDLKTMNDTYLEQVVGGARAAIQKASEMGVGDPERVGVGGHSYGAFMTANLLAHSKLFRAGIARSGAYNRTLTPFGFQSERRALWEAPDTYLKMSPFMYADKIKDPILLIHGEADDNTGTHPIQSDRMYQAIRGNGGTVRLVTLPHEAHGYTARESIEHTLYEMIAWFDKYVKNAALRAEKKAAALR